MSFDSYKDSPFQLNKIGERINVTVKYGVPSSGQLTVEWSIPNDIVCKEGQDPTGYCGIIFVLSDKPFDQENLPRDGKIYKDDPTADPNLHTGDKIGEGLVIGAFYEREKVGRGEPLTTKLIVNDIKPNKPYYIIGYPVDCNFRYYKRGIRGYSDRFGSYPEEVDRAARAVLLFNEGDGIKPSDGTGLVPGQIYKTVIDYNDDYPNKTSIQEFEIEIDGGFAGTYEDLVKELNKKLKLLENPFVGSQPPNAGVYVWDGEKLYQFDGHQVTEITPVIIENFDFTTPNTGDYWFNPDTEELFIYNDPNPGWNPVSYIRFKHDFTDPQCNDFWFDGSQGRIFDGTAWCEVNTIISTTNPSEPQLSCDNYWYDTKNQQLFKWNEQDQKWEQIAAIYWDVSPDSLVNGTYWFDETNNKLFQWDGTTWNDVPVVISTEEPTGPSVVPGLKWYNPETEELNIRNTTNDDWDLTDLIVWPEDPTLITSCEYWWNSTTDELYVWESSSNTWVKVQNFVQQENDPSQPIIYEPNSFWYDPNTGNGYFYNGTTWEQTEFVNLPVDPRTPPDRTVWYDTTNSKWFYYDLATTTWIEFDPADTTFDPTAPPVNTFWFDPTTSTLSMWNGTNWQTVGYQTSVPYPKENDQWYDPSTDTLYKWDGDQWIETQSLIYVELTELGNIDFVTRGRGSNYYIEIHQEKDYLFRFLQGAVWRYLKPIQGADGIEPTPTYVYAGDDGSPDERRALIDRIKRRLGWPVVAIELDDEQLNVAVQTALDIYRERSGGAYRQTYFFLDIVPGVQSYKLTNKTIGYDKIVTVTRVFRFTSAFLSTAQGAGAYGQIVLQHLYNMGTYDLTSYALVSQYVEMLEIMLAARLAFYWDEATRTLDFYQRFTREEVVLLETATEKTEQEIFKDRWSKQWIERWALAEARTILAEIRGKYGSLPGAGGGVQLNAADLLARADQEKEQLLQQMEQHINSAIDDWGLEARFLIG